MEIPAPNLVRFNRLIRDLLQGSTKRNSFEPWEIELLLDFDACNRKAAVRRECLKRYTRAVQRRLEAGEPRLLKLSEFLDRR